ncbi:hypothetical protein Taro_051296 [Colocasia esculenta]|uniref:Uncharacterized protein n=1 Tax=Colocasia esculenta TaxID=4460 RepID=A0A843XFL1_COLES|nr:hypothetical protein [Colocasia esculenta]
MRSHRQPATAVPKRNLGAGPEISESGNKPEGVTISAMFGNPYPRPGEEISRRVEHDFRSLRLGGSACGLRQ